MIIVISMATENAMIALWMSGKVTHVGFDEFQHADVGRNPRQNAQTGDQNDLLISPLFARFMMLWRAAPADANLKSLALRDGGISAPDCNTIGRPRLAPPLKRDHVPRHPSCRDGSMMAPWRLVPDFPMAPG